MNLQQAGVLLCLLLSACGGETAGPEAPAAEAQSPVRVTLAAVERRMVEDRIAAVGSVAAESEVAVAARILSRIESVGVDEGDRVRAGQVVIRLDDRDLKATVEVEQAGRQEAAGALGSAEQAIRAAQADLDLARRTYERFSKLLEKESVSQQEFDRAKAGFESAEAALALAEARREQAVAAALQAEAAVDRAEVALDFAVVRAPVSGLVASRTAEPGATAVPGVELLRIEKGGSYRLEVAAPELLAGAVRVGQTVPVEIDALSDAGPEEGRVVGIVPSVNPGSRTFTVKIALPRSTVVRSGLFGKAFFPGPEREVLVVPSSAVTERGQLRFVFVAGDGRGLRRSVTVGEARGEAVEILSGLDAGERVVLEPGELRDGDPIEARSPR